MLYPERDVEGLEVLDQRSAVLPEVHGPAELGGIRRGELDAVDAARSMMVLEAERAVEVDVQVALGELAEELERELVLAEVGVVYHDLLYQHGICPGAVSGLTRRTRGRPATRRAAPPGP